MIKKILIFSLMLLWSGLATAKSGLNIFAYPREAPQTPIYTSEGKAVKLGELKGKFSFRSKEGEGSVFYIELGKVK